MDGVDNSEQTGEQPAKKDVELPNFRIIALAVAQDETLADPFSDGAIDESSPAEDRDALKAILTTHFGYTEGEVEDVGNDACRFIGRNGQPILIRTGSDDSNGDTYLEFTPGLGEPRRLLSASLKLGAPIAIALAHQKPNQLARIYDGRKKDPHVSDICKIEVAQQSGASSGVKTNTYILQGARFRQSETILGERRD